MRGMCGVQGISERNKENFPQFLCPCLAILAVSFLHSLFLSVSLSLSEPVSAVLPQSGRLPDLSSA